MSNKLVKEEQVLVLTDAIIKKINELGLKISENDSSFRGFIKPNSAAPILRGLYICEDSGVYVYFGQINVTADEINSGIVFINYTATAFNKVALPLTNFIKKTDLGKPNSAASLGADGLLLKEQRWEVAIDFNQENTPIWLNTPPPTKAGVFYPSEAGTYGNYGSITISAADLNSNIVRIQFDGVNRFQKMVVGLNGQFLPLTGGIMTGDIVLGRYPDPGQSYGVIKAIFNGTQPNTAAEIDFIRTESQTGYGADIVFKTNRGVPGDVLTEAGRFTRFGQLILAENIKLKSIDNVIFEFTDFNTGQNRYILGSGGSGDDVMAIRKIDNSKYTLSMWDLIAKNTIQTPNGNSEQWNDQTKKSISRFTNYILPSLQNSEIWVGLMSAYAEADTVSVDLTLIDTLYISDGVGTINISFVFQVFNARINRQFSRVTSVLGNAFGEYYIDPVLQVRNGIVGVSIKRRSATANPILIRTDYTTSENQSPNVLKPTLIESVSELTNLINTVDFPFSPKVPNPTLAQDAIPMQWANDRFTLKSNLSILDGKIGTIDRDLIAVQVATDINTVSLNTVSDTVTRQGQSIMQTNSDIGEVRRDYFSKISSDLQNITSPVVFDKLAVFKTVEVPYSRSLNAPVNNSVLADAIAEIPSGGIEIIYETQEIQPIEQVEIDLTEKAIKRVPTASFIYENESGLICMGDLNIATKLNLFTYELLMSDRPKFKMNAVSKQLNDFKLYR